VLDEEQSQYIKRTFEELIFFWLFFQKIRQHFFYYFL